MKEDRPYLEDIAEAIARIERYPAAGRSAFLEDKMAQDAVVRNFEVIGEAVKRLTPSTTDRQSGVRWSDVAGLRDVLIHQYMHVDLGRLWTIIERDPPKLKQATQQMLDA